MATKKKTTTPEEYTLTKGDRTWTTKDRAEVTSLRARGWTVDEEPEVETAARHEPTPVEKAQALQHDAAVQSQDAPPATPATAAGQ